MQFLINFYLSQASQVDQAVDQEVFLDHLEVVFLVVVIKVAMTGLMTKETIPLFQENQVETTLFMQIFLKQVSVVILNSILVITLMLKRNVRSSTFVPIIKLMTFYVQTVRYFTKNIWSVSGGINSTAIQLPISTLLMRTFMIIR